MMKMIAATLIVTALLVPTVGARADDVRCVPPIACQKWGTTFSAPAGGNDFFMAVDVSPDGRRVFGVGTGTWNSVGREFATYAFDASTGAPLWNKHHGGAGDFEFAYDVDVAPDGSLLYTTGWRLIPGTFARRIEVVAYDPNDGTEVWVAVRGDAMSPPVGNFPSWHIEGTRVSPDGSLVFVLGHTTEGVATAALDAATGEERWASLIPVPTGVETRAIAVGPDGARVYVTGYRQDPAGNDDGLLAALDARTGATLWTSFWDGSAGGRDRFFDVAAGPDDERVYVTGVTNGASSNQATTDMATVAFRADDGAILWEKTFHGGAAGDEARRIGVSPWGDLVFVTGRSAGTDSEWDAVTIAYDAADGGQAWLSRFTGNGEWEWGSDIEVAPGGHRVYVAGLVSRPFLSSNFATLAYDSDAGVQVWLQEWNVAGLQDEAYALALDPRGTDLYACGYGGGFGEDFSIVGYGPMSVAPIASLGADPTTGDAPLTVTFDILAADADGLLDGWKLDADGDGIAEYGARGLPPATLTHTYERVGTFAARLMVSDDHGAVGRDTVTITVTGTVSVDAPGALALALRGPVPNPSHRELVVWLSLPRAEPATLELVDVVGRRVVLREVGSLGAGNHAFNLGEGRKLSAGIYLVRLTQGSHAVSTKVVVVP